MLLGMSKPIHVLTASATARAIVNLTALAASAVVPGAED
jgi:malate dehydrogenase (oxaloacetate-decarboxylating)(NADP+)